MHTTTATRTATRKSSARSRHYSFPADVAKHVSVVGDLVRFPRLKPASLIQEVILQETNDDDSAWTKCGASYSGFVNPHVLAERYGFEFPKLSHAKGNSLGLADFQSQYYDDPGYKPSRRPASCRRTSLSAKSKAGMIPRPVLAASRDVWNRLLDIEYAGAVAGAIPLKGLFTPRTTLC